jgi:hypothetical protein
MNPVSVVCRPAGHKKIFITLLQGSIGKYPSCWGRGKYQLMSFEGTNMKRPSEKGGKCKRKRKKGEENEKRGSKRVK